MVRGTNGTGRWWTSNGSLQWNRCCFFHLGRVDMRWLIMMEGSAVHAHVLVRQWTMPPCHSDDSRCSQTIRERRWMQLFHSEDWKRLISLAFAGVKHCFKELVSNIKKNIYILKAADWCRPLSLLNDSGSVLKKTKKTKTKNNELIVLVWLIPDVSTLHNSPI